MKKIKLRYNNVIKNNRTNLLINNGFTVNIIFIFKAKNTFLQ